MMKLKPNKLLNLGMILGMGVIWMLAIMVGDIYAIGSVLIDLFGSQEINEE